VASHRYLGRVDQLCQERAIEAKATLGGMDSEWTVERHLLGKPPEVIALYHRFIELAEACGPFTYAVAKSAITLKGTRRGFAGAVPGLRAAGILGPASPRGR
jgi:hypothetical protein